MTSTQKIIKYAAIAIAILLAVSIIFGILSAVLSIFGIFGGDATTDDITVYTPDEKIKNLKLEIGAADFKLVEGDAFKIESNLKHLNVSCEKETLEIIEKKHNHNYNNAVLTLYVPKDFIFEKAEIKTGAGKFSVVTLSADLFDLELGAGAVNIEKLCVNKGADIEGGAGELNILSGKISDIDIEMGVGELNLTAELCGNGSIDCGIGESNINLLGDKDAYRINIEKGIGSATVDGEAVSNNQTVGNGENILDLSVGIGSCKVEFEDK